MKKKILLSFFVIMLGIFVSGALSAFAATTVNVSSVSDLQSAHPYSNSMDTTWIYTHPTSAESLAVTFSSDTEAESNYDYIYILDGSGNQIEKYSGTTLAGKTVTVPGKTVKIRLTSDGSVTKYGFRVTSIVANSPSNIVASGTCGDSITWVLDSEGTLSISGNGPMRDYSYSSSALWYSNRSNIKNVVIKDGVTSIGDYAFYNCDGLTSVTIPDSVTSIGDYAFRGCSSLTSVTIGDSVKTIGDYAFSGCSSLTSVNITDIAAWCKIEFSDYLSNPLYYAKKLYLDGNIVTNLIIPDSVTTIGGSAFYSCSSLTSVTIPDSVTSIGDYAFRGCSSLTSVTIGDSVKTIGDYAFYSCSSLTSVTIPDSVTSIGGSAFYGCSSLTRVNITDIAAWCNIEFSHYASNPLYYAKKLYLDGKLVTNLIIPDSVTSIGDDAFYGCSSLISVTIGDSVTTIGGSAFYSCSSLTSVTIPDSVTTIVDYAFRGCSSLTSVTIGGSVTTIGDYAFYYCSSLTSVTIPDSVTSIGDYAFSDCDGLTSVTIGSGVELIPESAFYSCNNLKYVSLSDELLYIRNDAFNGCTSLSAVFYEGNEEQWQSILFYNRNENLTNAKIVYNAEKRTYKFETNCDGVLPDITDFAVFTSPVVENEGSTLIGWYDNADLEGNAVTFPYYGDATTLYAAWTGRTGKNFDDALIAKANREYNVTTTQSGEIIYFEFVPKQSKKYNFYSTGSKDTYGYLYNSSKTQLSYDDDTGEGNNFYISYNLTAGNTYYIAVKLYSGTGTFTFAIEEPVDYRINSVTLKDTSGNTITSIPKGEFLATVSFTNISSSEDSVVVLAQYTNTGAFKGLMYVSCEDVPTSSTMKLTIPVDNKDGDITKLKALCWSSIGSMDPMGDVVSFPAE